MESSHNVMDIAISCLVKKNRDMVIKKDADFVHFVVFCLNVYLVLAGSMQEKCPISLVCCCHRHRKRSGFNLLQ